MKKRWFILGALVFFAIFVIADVGDLYQWHTSDIILVEIDGFNITLQDAINNNYFGSVHPTADSNYPFYSHLASEILVTSPNGYTMTLQEMSDTDSFVAGVADLTTEVEGGHSGEDIRVYSIRGGIMPLQDLIEGGYYCNPLISCLDFPGQYGTLDNECGGTIYCEEPCVDNDYVACYDNDLYNYDSCGARGTLVEDCGVSGWTGWTTLDCNCFTPGFPLEYNYYYTRGCLNGKCYETLTDTDDRDADCCSVICTELNRVGLMDDETYGMDSEFSRAQVSPEALRGYRAWGNVVVELMREDKKILAISDMMVEDFTDEIAYRMGRSDESNEAGALYLDEAMPLFERVGILIDEPMLPEFLRWNPNDKIVESYFNKDAVSEMFYDALGNKTEPDMEFNRIYLELMTELVEEIEAEVMAR